MQVTGAPVTARDLTCAIGSLSAMSQALLKKLAQQVVAYVHCCPHLFNSAFLQSGLYFQPSCCRLGVSARLSIYQRFGARRGDHVLDCV